MFYVGHVRSIERHSNNTEILFQWVCATESVVNAQNEHIHQLGISCDWEKYKKLNEIKHLFWISEHMALLDEPHRHEEAVLFTGFSCYYCEIHGHRLKSAQ